ncbi:hypothetical protein J2X01_003972, partial [Arthrobacter ginsengisoli]|nr:hypothetical protein [Arthrobacter ginsengisoli]
MNSESPKWRTFLTRKLTVPSEVPALANMSLSDARSGLKMVPWSPVNAVSLWFF